MSEEVKVEKVEEKADKALFARVRKVENRLDKIVKWAEDHYGVDIDGDGKTGSVALRVLAVVLICAMASGIAGAATIWNLKNSAGADLIAVDDSGNLMVTGGVTVVGALSGTVVNSNATGHLTASNGTFNGDVAVAGALTGTIPATSISSGNIASARLTNAAGSLGPSIGGNIPVAAITNAAGSIGASIGGNIPAAAMTNGVFLAISNSPNKTVVNIGGTNYYMFIKP